MTEAYNDALADKMEKGIFDTLKDEAANMSAMDYATTTADIVGIFDPTPASDLLGAAMSGARGDWFGMGMSFLGMIPYVGDLGKIGKIARVAPRTAKTLEMLLTKSDELATAGRNTLKQLMRLDDVAAARRAATERVRNAMRQARKGNVDCEDCAKLVGPGGERRTLQMPSGESGGKWRGGGYDADFNGVYDFDNVRTLPDGRTVSSIEYRNGMPNFDDYLDGGKRYDLWEVSGDATVDGRRLRDMMRETNPNWRPPSSDDFVLHHLEDGGVGYVPRTIHDRDLAGASHTGGNSILNNDLF